MNDKEEERLNNLLRITTSIIFGSDGRVIAQEYVRQFLDDLRHELRKMLAEKKEDEYKKTNPQALFLTPQAYLGSLCIGDFLLEQIERKRKQITTLNAELRLLENSFELQQRQAMRSYVTDKNIASGANVTKLPMVKRKEKVVNTKENTLTTLSFNDKLALLQMLESTYLPKENNLWRS